MKNKILFLVIAAQLRAFGVTLKAIDADNKGNDDLFGTILDESGQALSSYASSDDKGFKKYLRIIADSIYTFLGLTVPGQ